MYENSLSRLLKDKTLVNEIIERRTFPRTLQKLNGKADNVTVNIPKPIVDILELRKGQIVNFKLERKDGKSDGERRIVIIPTQEYRTPEAVIPDSESVMVLGETTPVQASA